jgi:hypothetical protein
LAVDDLLHSHDVGLDGGKDPSGLLQGLGAALGEALEVPREHVEGVRGPDGAEVFPGR